MALFYLLLYIIYIFLIVLEKPRTKGNCLNKLKWEISSTWQTMLIIICLRWGSQKSCFIAISAEYKTKRNIILILECVSIHSRYFDTNAMDN